MQVNNLTPQNVVKAVHDYIALYTAPPLSPERIFWGNQNNIALPKDNEYAVFTYLSTVRYGTNAVTWEKQGADKVQILETIEQQYQVDFYADTQNGKSGLDAMYRAQCIETVSRSSFGVDFFNQQGMSLMYCDEPRDLTLVGDSNSYIRRASVTLHLSMNVKIEIFTDFFSSVILDLKNVDVHYPPKEK